ncbi:MAG: hypothetical protein MUP16_00900 [Sedimentisphaerales bacterium]|nr:hypothetical protein [Sedimentisphaerales bacterium]
MNPYEPKILTGNRIQFACGCIELTHPDNIKGDEHTIRQNLASLADSHQEKCREFNELCYFYLESFPSADDDDPDKTDFEP